MVFMRSWHANSFWSSHESEKPKKKSRLREMEEKILIELLGENEDKLKYKAHTAPEWQSMATQLREICKREQVDCSKSVKQCRDKVTTLTKKYKNPRDKLRTTKHDEGGYNADDDDSGSLGLAKTEERLITNHLNNMGEILGGREAVNSRYVLESSTATILDVDSSPELDEEDKKKEALDEEFFNASKMQEFRASQNISTACVANAADFTDDEEPMVAKKVPVVNKWRIQTSRAGKELTENSSKKKAAGSRR